LMQVIQPTFDAYAMNGFNKNIFDPLSNIIASIRYTKATYGSLKAGWDRKGGYAGGGIVKPFLYDQGGEIPPGVRLIANKTSRPEKVLPPAESEALTTLARDGSGGNHFHYSPQQLDLDHEIERRTRREYEAMVHAAEEEMFT